MREIKFRAWDGKKMFKADAIYLKGCYHYRFTVFEKDTAVEVGAGDNGEQEMYESSEKIMQYTGLKDKNGVEIYEGDIYSVWKDKGNPEVVEWRRGGFKLPNEEYIEVIGNIYESPELLS